VGLTAGSRLGVQVNRFSERRGVRWSHHPLGIQHSSPRRFHLAPRDRQPRVV